MRTAKNQVAVVYTVGLRSNEPLYNEVLGMTNNFIYPSNSKIYGKERRYNEAWPFVI